MRVRGMRDIKTHGTLARAGLLISVARDLHRMENRGTAAENSDWNVEQHVFKKDNRRSSPPLYPPRSGLSFPVDFGKKVREHLLRIIPDVIAELRQAAAEGIPVSIMELERLENRLSQLKSAANN